MGAFDAENEGSKVAAMSDDMLVGSKVGTGVFITVGPDEGDSVSIVVTVVGEVEGKCDLRMHVDGES